MTIPRTRLFLLALSLLFPLMVSCGSSGGGGGGEEPPPPSGFEPLAEIAPDGTQVAARFGHSVAVDAGLAVVGAPLEDDGGIADRGAAYIFRLTAEQTWELEARLLAPDGAVDDRFGSAVAISGDDVLVGAPFRDDAGIADQGAAYLFRRTDPAIGAWEAITILTAADGAVGDQFGSAVAISGDDALVGAPFRDDSGIADLGAAYLFRRTAPATDAWAAITTLTAGDGTAGDRFGSAVALADDDALVGAPFRDDAGIADRGAAYLFRRTDPAADTWEATAILTIAGGAENDRFGSSVAISGDDALVGAPFRDGPGIADQGAAYLFGRTDRAADTWEAAMTLTAADGTAFDHFGSAVAIDGDDALVGAPFADTLGFADSGAAYPFLRP